MSQKKSIQVYADLAKKRNHELISVSNQDTPSKGTVTIKCNTCGQTFETTAHSYSNARQTGCPYCKAIKARAQPKRVQFSEPKEEMELRKKLKRKQNRLERREKRKAFSFLKDGTMLKEFLQKEDNVYTRWILEKIELLKKASLEGDTYEIHHIIPVHAGGPDSKWNLISLTKQDHIKAHILRFEAYGEFGDYNFLTTQPDILGVLVERNAEFDAQIATNRKNASESTRRQLDPELVGEADLNPVRVRTKQQEYGHQYQMSSSVKKALYNGSRWIHQSTGIIFTVEPEQALTLTQLKDIFINQLPEDHENRKQIEKAKTNTALTSAISKVIKTFDNTITNPKLKRNTVAGFSLLEIFEKKED